MNGTYIIQSERIAFRSTLPEDLSFVLSTESDASNTPFIGGWTEEKHLNLIKARRGGHFIVEKLESNTPIGYVIIPDIENPNRGIELRRIVISEKGAGYGREALGLLKRLVFEKWKMHRLWLDVMEHNERARHLYKSEGFVEEGVWREAYYDGENYVSLVFMSILESEWER